MVNLILHLKNMFYIFCKFEINIYNLLYSFCYVLNTVGLFPYKVKIINKPTMSYSRIKTSFSVVYLTCSLIFLITFALLYLTMLMEMFDYFQKWNDENFGNTMMFAVTFVSISIYISSVVFWLFVLKKTKELSNLFEKLSEKLWTKKLIFKIEDFCHFIIIFILFVFYVGESIYDAIINSKNMICAFIILRSFEIYKCFCQLMFIFIYYNLSLIKKSMWTLNIGKISHFMNWKNKISKNSNSLQRLNNTNDFCDKMKINDCWNKDKLLNSLQNDHDFNLNEQLQASIIKAEELNHIQTLSNKIFFMPLSIIIVDQMIWICVCLYTIGIIIYNQEMSHLIISHLNIVVFFAISITIICESSNNIFNQVRKFQLNSFNFCWSST